MSDSPSRPVCRHCTKCVVTRPRGLCWNCYYQPGVKDQYPSTSKYAHRGVGNITGGRDVADEPTTAAPGTPEKVAVMAGRASLGRSLFHPADARWGPSAAVLLAFVAGPVGYTPAEGREFARREGAA